jgi:hypothetical protein
MKQLSEECIKAITEVLPMKDGVPYYLDQWEGAKEALINPKIYTKADLVHKDEVKDLLEENKYLRAEFESNKDKVLSKEDALRFALWCEKSGYDYHESFEIWVAGMNKKTTEELFNLYINQKK